MFDNTPFSNARWGDLYVFFAAGDPPLALRLLAINTIFLVLFVIRRARGMHPMRADTAYVVQALLIAANIFIMFGPNLLDATLLAKYMI